ncbi:MAG TPA: hypothetical protein VJV79_13125 [Polyangiaceae bacterium]|nr:hypothetical protein [Polyangiaceae bacterium]
MSIDFWKRAFRRWFIEYNPLYLLSACCVLVGVNELSQGLSHSPYSGVGVAAVAELYAWALIASAAFLVRLELRRPAVMLALVVAVYQCDPTLHTETCAYLGGLGVVAGAAWLASFVAKIVVLASAMRVRLSRPALLVPTLGALGVLLFPPLLRQGSAISMSSLVALWLFALFALGFWGSFRITSLVGLDDWGRTVMKRTVSATWAIWAVLTLGHAWFWASEFELRSTLIVPVALLLSTRWMPRESSAWLAVAGALLCGILMPPFFATIAGMAAITLALRALRQPIESPAHEPGACEGNENEHFGGRDFGFAQRPERMRLLVGSASVLYLSGWTMGWAGGVLPAHAWWLDTLFTAVLLGMVWGLRAYVALVPLALSYLHLGVQAGTVSLPRTRAQWGLTEVGLGFALLATAVLTSWQSRNARTQGRSSLADTSEDPAPPL